MATVHGATNDLTKAPRSNPSAADALSKDGTNLTKEVHGRLVNNTNEVCLDSSCLETSLNDVLSFTLYLVGSSRHSGLICTHHTPPLVDSEEHDRLTVQHRMLKTKMGGLYYPSDAVRRILAPRPEGSVPPKILDIGTGSGEQHNIPLVERLTDFSKGLGQWIWRTSSLTPRS